MNHRFVDLDARSGITLGIFTAVALTLARGHAATAADSPGVRSLPCRVIAAAVSAFSFPPALMASALRQARTQALPYL